MSLKDKAVEKIVKVRTSFLYVWAAILLPILWVTLHRWNVLHIDNFDMTYLNLSLSIMAEVQGVILLIYTSRIMDRQANADEHRAKLLRKMQEIHKIVDTLETDLEDIDEDLHK